MSETSRERFRVGINVNYKLAAERYREMWVTPWGAAFLRVVEAQQSGKEYLESADRFYLQAKADELEYDAQVEEWCEVWRLIRAYEAAAAA